MSHCVVPNYLPPSNGDHFDVIWKLTRALKKAGWTYMASSDGTAKDAAGAADKWGTDPDPFVDVIPTLGSGAWWCAQGPSLLKVPISAGAVGTFVKGENVIQGGSGAEGEILGVVFDATYLGWAVIAPRVDGSGGGPQGWDATGVITGDLSGATITPTATVLEFVVEVVFWRSNTLLAGSVYFQSVDTVAEATSRYSALAASAGCTATIAPGGGGTGNAFPTPGSWVALGTGGSVGHAQWTVSADVSAISIGAEQIMVANCTSSAGVSADGSFICAFGNPGVNAGSFTGFAFQRCDDQEDGDVCPFVSIFNTYYTPIYTNSRTVATSCGGCPDNWTNTKDSAWRYNGSGMRSWRRRGISSADAFTEVEPMILSRVGANNQTATTAFYTNIADPEKVACDPAANTWVAEPVWVGSLNLGSKIRKGTLRWMFWTPTGNGTDTWKNKQFLQLSSAQLCVMGGPWDGVSTPSNS